LATLAGIPGKKRLSARISLAARVHCEYNSRRYPVHPNRWMRRYWTVGPKPTKRSQRVDFFSAD
jgi:hypothetical protein